jgi:signal transduction histidine kinase
MAATPAARRTRDAPTPSRAVLLDAALAVAAFALSLVVLRAFAEDDGGRGLDAAGVALAGVAALALLGHRRAPLAAFVVAASTSVVMAAAGYPIGPPIAATAAVLLLAASPRPSRVPRWGAAAIVGAFLLLHAGAGGLAQDELPTVPLLWGTVVWGGAWVLGDRVRDRRRHLADLEERARRAELDAERERRLAAAEERTRIARDLHDSAGHAITVILVQAGAARLLRERDPERARAALETIEEVARETLGEIESLVRALREGDRVEVEPPPGVAALPALADRHRAAGLPVSVATAGAPRGLPPVVDQAAYRIVQEALTNAARHGGGGATVRLRYEPSALVLTVDNPLRPGTPAGPAGHGLVGMGERATLLGGSVTARAEGRTFRVRARLPAAGALP